MQAIGALCIALLVDKGLVKYSDLVSKYWPEFAQNGKESITIDWIMSHRVSNKSLKIMAIKLQSNFTINEIISIMTTLHGLSFMNHL